MKEEANIRRDARYGLERFAKTADEFSQFYESDLHEEVTKLEKMRKAGWNKIKLLGLLLIVAELLVLIFKSDYFILPLIIIVPYIIQAYKREQAKLDQALKDELIPDLIQFIHSSLTYKPNRRMPKELVQDANFFKSNIYRYKGEDYFSGKLEDEENDWATDLQFGEVRLVDMNYVKDDKGRGKWEESSDIARGMFYVADFNKDFGDSVTTIYLSDLPKRTMVDFEALGMEKVELENIDFMDDFTVYSTDQIMSRVILTPDMMEKIYQFTDEDRKLRQGEFEGVKGGTWSPDTIKHVLKGIKDGTIWPKVPYITFKNNKLYLLLNTGRDHFSVALFRPFDEKAMVQYFEEINTGLQLIDELNLNLKLYVEK